jgi:hypothetical protein
MTGDGWQMSEGGGSKDASSHNYVLFVTYAQQEAFIFPYPVISIHYRLVSP